MAERLLDLAWSLGHWAYALVFLVAALEASAFIGLVVPGETLTVSSGFLASAGVLNLAPTIVAAALGAIVGDSIGYEMGRRLGRAWLMRHGPRFGFSQSRLGRIEALFGQYGGLMIFLARFIGFLRAFAPFLAGAADMPYRKFLFFNFAGAWAWACTFVLVGYFLGESWWIAERWVGRVGLIAAAVVVAAGLFWLRRLRRTKMLLPEPSLPLQRSVWIPLADACRHAGRLLALGLRRRRAADGGRVLDLRVHLAAEQQHESREVEPQHEEDHARDRAVRRRVVTEVRDVEPQAE